MLTEGKIRRIQTRKAVTFTDRWGLELWASPTGLRTWRYRYQLGTKTKRVTLGHWPEVPLAKARMLRAEMEARVKLDGQELKAYRPPSFKDFAGRYLREMAVKVRKDPQPLRRLLVRDILPWIGRIRVDRVTVQDIQGPIFLKRDQGHPAAALAIRDLIKRIFDYAQAVGLVTVNPADATKPKFVGQRKSRARSLSAREIGEFLRNLYGSNRMNWEQRRAIHLLLLTMARKSELRLAQWKHVDFTDSSWEIPAEHSKTGKAHIVYLSRQAQQLFMEIFEAMWSRNRTYMEHYVLPHQSSATQPQSATTLNQAMYRIKWPMPHFTIHDLRRTAATILNEQGFNRDVIEKALNHTLTGIRGVYNRAEYAEQRKQMLQAWADFVDQCWKGESGPHGGNIQTHAQEETGRGLVESPGNGQGADQRQGRADRVRQDDALSQPDRRDGQILGAAAGLGAQE